MVAEEVEFGDLGEAVEAAAIGTGDGVAVGEAGVEGRVVIEAFAAIGYEVVGVELLDEGRHFGGPSEEGVGVAGVAEFVAEFPG